MQREPYQASRTGCPAGLFQRAAALGLWILLAIPVLGMLSGCASGRMVSLRAVPNNPLADQLQLSSWKGPKPSPRTVQLLRMYDLEDDLDDDPRILLEKLASIVEQQPTAQKVHAAAELSYLFAAEEEGRDPRLALDLYGNAVFYAYDYLFNEKFAAMRNPYDPQFRGACDLYNAALESGLRLICEHDKLMPGRTQVVRTANGSWDITCVLRGGRWRPEDFDHFEFVSDYELTGLRNHYQTYGLGVPLIAVRRSYEGESPAAKYYPPGLSFPVTAFLRPKAGTRPLGPDGATRRQAHLELYDPLASDQIVVNNRRVPLQSDLTTPMAFYLSDPTLDRLATVGLLRPDLLLAARPDRPDPIMGLYMMQPYEPGKIPVLLIHGLWSSPITWTEMYNDLRSSPEIRKHYQFWFYFYPTGQPFLLSAYQLRQDLAEARQLLDPHHEQPALDQMVLVGHSMGGLVARLQTIHSRDDFWQMVSDEPFDRVKAEPEVRQQLAGCFFFRPNPSVRRVLTIGTPHRGSNFSNDTTRWLTSKLIRLPQMLVDTQEKLFRDNQGLFRDTSAMRVTTSVDALSPDSPVFPVMLASYRAPWVRYHNIIGSVPSRGILGTLAAGSDGVVTLDSARVDDVESELVVPADHTTIHAHPRAVLEVRRILLAHLAEARRGPSRLRTAQSPQEANAPEPAHVER